MTSTMRQAGPARPTGNPVLPDDQIQRDARRRDVRLMWMYGIGSVVYIVLAVVAVLQVSSFLTTFLEPQVRAAAVTSGLNIDGLDQFISVIFWVQIVFFVVMIVVPMIVAIVNFVTRLRRWRRYVYCSSPAYLQSLVDGQADAATRETIGRITKELMYVNRKCPNCGRWLWTPAEGTVECPSCARRV
ncbi:hypothetical protein [Bifidobacterium sp. SO1]|uniref:hypothetical protein n=1 Tax=Bifidobacterium sp. SO1 TaxID=2809029 RepID=UPI001BDC3896|nr:hypothetical protein [Bifidobacterium sp. SO1]MBT1161422.1 hypothetical protein [Bifidobacterium sp. SO1]